MITKQTPALAAALSAIDAIPQPDDSARLIAAKCRALVAGYDARFSGTEYVPIAIEQMYTSELVNPDTSRCSRTYSVAGLIDVLARHGEQTIVIDHKSTSQDIEDPSAPFWRQLAIEGQVSHYMLLLWQNGLKCDGAVWDVMRKPGISPKKLTKAEARSVASLGEYFGRLVTIDSPATWDERETLEMYESRLAWDCTKERPQHYFQRRSVPRLDSELLEYARELWEHGQEMLHAHSTGRNARNSGACMLYGSPCKYLGICSGYDNPDTSGNWTYRQQVHRELPQLEGDGKNVITNSRIRCFQTCRRKHYHDYELGLERIDEEERESLVFGTIWHSALEAWWSVFLPLENRNGNCNDSAGSEPAKHSASEAAFAR